MRRQIRFEWLTVRLAFSDQQSPVSGKQRELIRNTNRKPITTYQMVPVSVILNDPNPDFKGKPLFDVEYLGYGTR